MAIDEPAAQPDRPGAPKGAAGGRPDIVFILADDLGWADLGVYGATDHATPHLDRLAEQGVRFTQAYANSAVCSASRFALITGRYQYRLPGGLEEPLLRHDLGLPPEHPTLPSLLRDCGYHTALIGKWHLGMPPAFGPDRSGYDHFFGNLGGALDYFTHRVGAGDNARRDLWHDDQPAERTGYYTDILADEACAYISTPRDQPYFLSLHFTAPHWPWEGPGDEDVPATLTSLAHFDGGSIAKYGEIVEALDAAVGRVLDAIERAGRADDTIVVFTSDNGGERFSKMWPFTGQKTELLEGGLRVPTLLRWRAVVPAQVCDQTTISADWLPTLLEAAGGNPHPDYPTDGQSILDVLRGGSPEHPRTLFWRYKAQRQRAVRDGDLKYLKINENEFLFDVVADPHERANLKDRHPEELERLRGLWEGWDADFLPITDDVLTHGTNPVHQADRYVPDERGPVGYMP